MLSENEYENEKIDNMGIDNSVSVSVICPHCGREVVLDCYNIEDNVDSDPHDPLYDYWVCKFCEEQVNLHEHMKCKMNNGDPAVVS